MSKLNRIIAIGGSAGALEALFKIISGLDPKLPCAHFVVLHGASDNFAEILTGHLPKPVSWKIKTAKNGEFIEPGRIYVAPADRHLLIQKGRMYVDKGPRVNRSRPAIDLLLRSAAVAYDSATVGIILSGLLSDGVAGVQAIKQCGGTAIVQDPSEALYPALPENTIGASDVDYIVPAGKIALLINKLAATTVPGHAAVPDNIAVENRLDINNEYSIDCMDQLGERASFSCPERSGPLWELNHEHIPRYRCHSGHSLTIDSLLSGQDSEIEKTLRVALRSFKEKKRVQEKLNTAGGKTVSNDIIKKRIGETDSHIDRLRKLIQKL